jgi:hypothetical protein
LTFYIATLYHTEKQCLLSNHWPLNNDNLERLQKAVPLLNVSSFLAKITAVGVCGPALAIPPIRTLSSSAPLLSASVAKLAFDSGLVVAGNQTLSGSSELFTNQDEVGMRYGRNTGDGPSTAFEITKPWDAPANETGQTATGMQENIDQQARDVSNILEEMAQLRQESQGKQLEIDHMLTEVAQLQQESDREQVTLELLANQKTWLGEELEKGERHC